MSKSGMSPQFAKFATKTTKGSYDDARQNERIGRGVPFPVGQKGEAVVSAVICDNTKPDPKTGESFPRVRVELAVEVPESHRGKSLSGPGLMQTIKDGRDPSKWSAEQAWGAMLGLLEDLGLPEEVSKGYKDFQECIDWFDDEPRRVNFEIVENRWTNAQGQEQVGKQVNAFAYVDEASIPSADTPAETEEDPNATYVTFRGTKHKVIGEDGDKLTIKGVNSGSIRTVDKTAVEAV